MLKFLNYVTAGFKISYDKSTDYIEYYTTSSKDRKTKTDENDILKKLPHRSSPQVLILHRGSDR